MDEPSLNGKNDFTTPMTSACLNLEKCDNVNVGCPTWTLSTKWWTLLDSIIMGIEFETCPMCIGGPLESIIMWVIFLENSAYSYIGFFGSILYAALILNRRELAYIC